MTGRDYPGDLRVGTPTQHLARLEGTTCVKITQSDSLTNQHSALGTGAFLLCVSCHFCCVVDAWLV